MTPPFEEFDTLIFTSSEGVKSFFGWLLESGRDVRAVGDRRIACIGSATARELMKYGLRADFVPEVYSGEQLAVEMVEQGFVNSGNRLILLRADIGSEDLTERLSERGIEYLDYPVYRTTLIEHGILRGGYRARHQNSQ